MPQSNFPSCTTDKNCIILQIKKWSCISCFPDYNKWLYVVYKNFQFSDKFQCILFIWLTNLPYITGSTAVGHLQLCFSNTLCHSSLLRDFLSVVQCHQPVDQWMFVSVSHKLFCHVWVPIIVAGGQVHPSFASSAHWISLFGQQ